MFSLDDSLYMKKTRQRTSLFFPNLLYSTSTRRNSFFLQLGEGGFWRLAYRILNTNDFANLLYNIPFQACGAINNMDETLRYP